MASFVYQRTLLPDAKQEGRNDNDIITVSVHQKEPAMERLDASSPNNLSSGCPRGRREIFSYTLNIPTTINEESSRGSTCRSPSPRLENLTMVRVVSDVSSDVTSDVMRCDSEEDVQEHDTIKRPEQCCVKREIEVQ